MAEKIRENQSAFNVFHFNMGKYLIPVERKYNFKAHKSDSEIIMPVTVVKGRIKRIRIAKTWDDFLQI